MESGVKTIVARLIELQIEQFPEKPMVARLTKPQGIGRPMGAGSSESSYKIPIAMEERWLLPYKIPCCRGT